MSYTCFNELLLTLAVPSAPRGLVLQLTQDDPPVVRVTWQRPRSTYGELEGFKLMYGRHAENTVQERRFDGEKYTFTTGFLGTPASPDFTARTTLTPHTQGSSSPPHHTGHSVGRQERRRPPPLLREHHSLETIMLSPESSWIWSLSDHCRTQIPCPVRGHPSFV